MQTRLLSSLIPAPDRKTHHLVGRQAGRLDVLKEVRVVRTLLQLHDNVAELRLPATSQHLVVSLERVAVEFALELREAHRHHNLNLKIAADGECDVN